MRFYGCRLGREPLLVDGEPLADPMQWGVHLGCRPGAPHTPGRPASRGCSGPPGRPRARRHRVPGPCSARRRPAQERLQQRPRGAGAGLAGVHEHRDRQVAARGDHPGVGEHPCRRARTRRCRSWRSPADPGRRAAPGRCPRSPRRAAGPAGRRPPRGSPAGPPDGASTSTDGSSRGTTSAPCLHRADHGGHRQRRGQHLALADHVGAPPRWASRPAARCRSTPGSRGRGRPRARGPPPRRPARSRPAGRPGR